MLSRQARIGTWLFWSLVIVFAAALLRLVPAILPVFSQPHWSLRGSGSFNAEGMYKAEYTADGQPFRWLSSASVLRLPLKAQPGTLLLRLQTGVVAGEPPRHLQISGQERIDLAAHDEIRTYSLFVPQSLVSQNQLSLELYSPRLVIAGEDRDLGMRIWGLGWHSLNQIHSDALLAGLAMAGSLLGLAAIVRRDWAGWRVRRRLPRAVLSAEQRGRRIDRLAFVALLLVYIAVFSGHYYSFDGMLMFHEARSLYYDQSFTFQERFMSRPPMSTSKYGIGLPLLYVPGIAITAGFQSAFGKPPANLNYQHIYTDTIYTLTGAPIHLLVAALTAYLVARFCRRAGLGQAAALWGCALFGLGSPALIYARGDFTQPVTALLWMGGLYAALGFRQSGRGKDILWCALCVGYGILTRPLEGAMLVPAALAVALPHPNPFRYTRRQWMMIASVGASVALTVAITLLVNRARYGMWLSTGYSNEGWYNPLWAGLKGLLISPARGLLWAFPALALAPLGLWVLWRRRQRGLAGVFAALILTTLLSMSMWHMWWGGRNWGPRLILPILPLLAVLAAAALDRLGRRWRGWIGGAALVSGLVWSLPGVLTDLLAGYGVLVDGPLASLKLEGFPLIGAWRYLDHSLANSLLDHATLDILWLRLARTTDGLSLLPMLAGLLGSALVLRRIALALRQPQPSGVLHNGAAETQPSH